jgi:hypothetical protein
VAIALQFQYETQLRREILQYQPKAFTPGLIERLTKNADPV